MKPFTTLLLALAGSLLANSAQAQYEFNDTKLGAYKQDFNTLSGSLSLTDSHLTDLPEVYAQSEFGTLPFTSGYTPPPIEANDGGVTTANYYHFGYADATGTDRSLGGIAATTTADGIGYIGVRLKNSSSVTIKNLEVQYAMEQWYNSGRTDAASVSVSYLKGVGTTALTSLLEGAGSWQSIDQLKVDAPSTGTVIASRDGNAAANRRVRQTTLTEVNLLPGQEIMIRWGYTLNNLTNGNGLSIDDIVVTPVTNAFYSKLTGMLDDVATWGINRDGTGTAPANFTDDNQTFYVLSTPTDRTDRITTVGTTGIWTVSGTNSKIVVGAPATVTTGTAAIPAGLYLEYNKNIVVSAIDVSDGSTFVIRNTDLPRTYALGSLSTSSTVEYNGTTSVAIITQNYGNLVIAGTSDATTPSVKSIVGNITVSGSVRLKNRGSLNLGNYDLTLVRRDSLSDGVKLNANIVRGGSPSSYVVTDGSGRLRISVPSNGVGIVFPVGSTAPTLDTTAYTPATLQQTATQSEDIFSVRVIDNIYPTYVALTEEGLGAVLSTANVNKTWLVGEEVAGGSDLTLTLQWNSLLDAALSFIPASARLKHYTNSAWDENTTTSEWGTTAGMNPNTLSVSRTHITSFSPFGVMSAVDPLPVKLTAFDVQATGIAATCTWQTASEATNDHFVVERSLDGVAFVPLGTVKGQGTSAGPTAYRFVDAAAGRLGVATVYYRLQQVDTDGQTAYSPVRAVSFATAAVALYPTPTPGNAATLDLTSLAAQPYQAQVLDLAGRVVLTRTLTGGLAHTFDVASLPAGAYLVVITGATTRQVVPLLRN